MAIFGFELLVTGNKDKYNFSFYKEIFNTTHKGETTITSLYYQHILRFFLKDTTRYYKVREVANWLVENAPLRTRRDSKKLLDPFNKRSGIVEDREKTIRNYFNQLKSWDMITSRTVSAEKAGSTVEFQLTPLGKLIGLLVEMDFEENREMVMNSFVEFFYSYCLGVDINSVNLFCRYYFIACLNEKLFHLLIDRLKEYLLYQHSHIYTINDIFTLIALSRTSDDETNKRLWKLWEYSFSRLNEQNQNLFLHHLKLFTDRFIEDRAISFGDYEDSLFEIKDNFNMVVIEFYCPNCTCNFYIYRAIPTLIYLQRLFNVITKIDIASVNKKINCSICDGELTCIII